MNNGLNTSVFFITDKLTNYSFPSKGKNITPDLNVSELFNNSRYSLMQFRNESYDAKAFKSVVCLYGDSLGKFLPNTTVGEFNFSVSIFFSEMKKD